MTGKYYSELLSTVVSIRPAASHKSISEFLRMFHISHKVGNLEQKLPVGTLNEITTSLY